MSVTYLDALRFHEAGRSDADGSCRISIGGSRDSDPVLHYVSIAVEYRQVCNAARSAAFPFQPIYEAVGHIESLPVIV